MVRVSVIIPCFNAERYIGETMQTVFAQHDVELEVIVIDDGSTDNSASVVEREFPSARVIRTPNRGVSAARNLGIELATGDYFQFLDADDLLAPGKLALQTHALSQPGPDVAYGAWQRFGANSVTSFVPGETVSRRLTQPEIDLFTDFWCPPAVYLFKRHIVEQVGGFRPELPVIQDARFALDCALHGARFTHVEAVVARYRVHSSGSVSTGDSRVFVRDCLTNAVQVEQWWRDHGGITDARKHALVQAYGYVARSSFERDRPIFEAAFSHICRLEPRYIPPSPRHLSLASRAVGYRHAEHLALYYRRGKSVLQRTRQTRLQQ
jgi:glycosyltransferase involved in cell wall biosynthesis